MKKVILTFSIMLLIAILMAWSSNKTDTAQIISQHLEIDALGGEQRIYSDTHSGNGDGIAYIVLKYSDDSVLKQIEGNDKWHTLPFDETTEILIYGKDDGTVKNGPYLVDDNGSTVMPEIRNGYYLLIDRQAQNGEAKGTDIIHRNSFNFDLGVYDTDNSILYFAQLDT